MSTKILFVDDDENILAGYQRSLRKSFPIETANGGAQGLARMNSDGPYAVIVADMQMPNMNGIEFLKQAEAAAPDSVRVMLTGNADQKTAADAVNQGHVFRFVNKPCPPETMTVTLEAALQQHRLIIAERELLENTLNGAVKILTDVLSAVDSRSFGQMRDHMRKFLQSFAVSKSWELELAAMLSHVGRVTLPPAVLMKESAGLSLSGPEQEMFLRVPEVGAELLQQIPRLENVAHLVRLQNKNFDGSGFPAKAPSGADIPIGARILKVLSDMADLEVKGTTRHAALHQMQHTSGRYDPQVLNAACRCFDVALAEEHDKAKPSIAVRTADLKTGQVVAEDVIGSNGVLVLATGTTLAPMLIERLRNYHALGTISNTIMVRE
jgi:response regulator RpfG family c-di-GMP phosphodiesterase